MNLFIFPPNFLLNKKILLSILMLITLNPIASIEACTGLRLTAKNGHSVHGRTLEFGIKVDTSVVVIPRGYSFIASTPQGKGLVYQTKYAIVGAICYDKMAVMDGMNEQGLSVGTFYFPGYASYTPTTTDNQKKSLSPIDFPNWILSQFKSLDEVKSNLSNVVIAPTTDPAWGNQPPPFHYIVYDKNGKSIVIEPLEGKLVVYDNPLGVFSNSPTFDWHMTNLRNFIHLTPKNLPPLKIGDLVLAPFGQGSGMVGLPGDFTPPSRFVRAAIFSVTATPPSHVQEAVFQTFHILNQFDIPIGLAREVNHNTILTDYTMITTVHDPINLKYYFKTYEDQIIKAVDLNTFDKSAKEIKQINTSGAEKSRFFIDISKEFNPINTSLY